MDRLRRLQIFLMSILLALLLGSCLEETPTELQQPAPNIPTPKQLSALVGQGQISVSWVFSGGAGVSGFNVFRSDDNGVVFDKLGNTSTSPFVDTTIRSGLLYIYRVAAIDAGGIQGPRSDALSVRAGFFDVVVNGNNPFTSSRNVQLSFTGSVGTQQVRFSESASFADAAWLEFRLTYPFTLSAGDGQKIVHAQFTDERGFMTESVADTIGLDTEALVQSASFTPVSAVAPGGTLRFSVTPANGELDGRADISIEGLGGAVSAFDNGSEGDAAKNDGVYGRDFILPSSFRGSDMSVTVTFTDAAGNLSDVFTLAQRLNITDPPAAVFIFPAEDSTTTSISLRWSESADEHFARYELFRDSAPTVSMGSSPRIATLGSSTSAAFTDAGVQEGESYYYVVYVFNDLEEARASNVRLAQPADNPPTSVVVDTLSSVSPTSLTVTWSRNNDVDFERYEVYQDTIPGVTNTPLLLVASISDRFHMFFDDSGLDTVNVTYYYRVYVFDKAGNEARSNEVSN